MATTSILIDDKLRAEAKALNIPLGKTLEDALMLKLNKNARLEQLKKNRKKLMAEARELKKQITELEEIIKKENSSPEKLSSKLEDAFKICENVKLNEGILKQDRIRTIAQVQGVPAGELLKMCDVLL